MMRIATFNLDSLGRRGRAEPDSRLSVLREAINGLRADVLCLQEIDAQTIQGGRRELADLDRLLRGTSYETFERHVSGHADGEGLLDVHNLVVLSRYPIRKRRQIWHSIVPVPEHRSISADPAQLEPMEIRWERPVLHTILEAGGDLPVHVFNVHFRAPLAAFVPGQKVDADAWRSTAGWAEGLYMASWKRIGQAFETRLAVDEVFDTVTGDARIVVCGDMNSEIEEMPLRILRADPADTGNPDLAARALVPIELMVDRSSRFTAIEDDRAQLPDHILASHPLADTCRMVEIDNAALAADVFDRRSRRGTAASNHAPIVAEFAI